MSDDYILFWKAGLCDLHMNGGDLREANRYFELAFNAHRACLERMAAAETGKTTSFQKELNPNDAPGLAQTSLPSALITPIPKTPKIVPIFKHLRGLPNTVVLVAGQDRAFTWDRTGVLVLAVGCHRTPDDIADEVYESTLSLWSRVANVFIVANPAWKSLRIKDLERLQHSLYAKTGTKSIWVVPDGSEINFIENLIKAKCRYTILCGKPKMIHKNCYIEEAWLESEVKEAVRPFLPAQSSKKSNAIATQSELDQADSMQIPF